MNLFRQHQIAILAKYTNNAETINYIKNLCNLYPDSKDFDNFIKIIVAEIATHTSPIA